MSPPRHPARPGGAASLLFCLALAAVPACGDATDRRPAVWEYISPAILQPNCATSSCHSQAAAVSGLDFSSPERGYTSLTALWVWIVDPNGSIEGGCRPYGDTFVCQRNHRPLVTPFDPAQSRVVHMLRAQGTARMPPDRPLPEADIALIETWILNGARQNRDDVNRDATVPVDSADGGMADGGTGDGNARPDGGGDAPAGGGSDATDGARADQAEAG